MFSYCLKCKKKKDSKNSRFVKTKNERIIILSNCAVCNGEKLRFIIEQENSPLLSSFQENHKTS